MDSKLKILVTGSSGQLGNAIKQISFSYPNYDFIFLNKSNLDITSHNLVRSELKCIKPNYIINCAAYTNVDLAESNQDIANLVNNISVKNLALVCKDLNITLVHLSTDYVFGNNSKRVTKSVTNKPYKESDIPAADSVYAKYKLEGEQCIIKTNLSNFLILRTSWLYSSTPKNFVHKILNQISLNKNFDVVNDQVGSPTFAIDLAEVILNSLKYINSENKGIYHYCSNDNCSRYEFALKIRDFVNSNVDIHPISSPINSIRPAFSALDPSKFCSTFGAKSFDWKSRLGFFIKSYNLHELNL
tara:strand:- start:48465 stop:49367 length:903 start_codon:yes stop_codon:yes gene_type:complete